MKIEELLNFPHDSNTSLVCTAENDMVRFSVGDLTTARMKTDDPFVKRISFDHLNGALLDAHISKEIEIRNRLDEGISFYERERYLRAVECFDDVIYYDDCYAEAILYKSRTLEGQGHFVKALRYYKRAVRCDENLRDTQYHKSLLKKANAERDSFPKIKLNIYAGDEHFTKGEYGLAVESYDRALMNPSKFKDMILTKLLNKKATALAKSQNYENALECFTESLNVGPTDYARFGRGLCEYELGREVFDGFKRPLKISKSLALRHALILNELGMFSQSMEITGELMKNHFRPDDYYLRLLNARMYAMRELDIDTAEIEHIFDSVRIPLHGSLSPNYK